MVDGSGLENRRTRKGTGGSNPSLSAIARQYYGLYDQLPAYCYSMALSPVAFDADFPGFQLRRRDMVETLYQRDGRGVCPCGQRLRVTVPNDNVPDGSAG